MSLITRCPACGTMFKVVADQLKISQGWVRCGHCAEVFDAAAQLQPAASLGSAAAGTGADAPLPVDTLDPASAAPPASFPVAGKTSASDVSPPHWEVSKATIPPPEIQVSLPPELSADMFVFAVSPEPFAFSGPALSAPAPDSAFSASEAPEHGSLHDVSFVRDARRHAFWRRPAMRWSLGLAALVLLAALLLQAVLIQKNMLAARQPWLGPGLQALCMQLHCEIKPPQQIESVVIDSSSFTKMGTDVYRLKVVIKNVGVIALAMPSLELSLTDTQEQALLRRVLIPGELGATAATLAPGAEFSGIAAIKISNPVPDAGVAPASVPRPSNAFRIAGYRVLAFYP